MRPEHEIHSGRKPVTEGELVVNAGTEQIQFRMGRVGVPLSDEPRRELRVQYLNDGFRKCSRKGGQRGRRPFAKCSDCFLRIITRVAHISFLESRNTALPVEPSQHQFTFDAGASCFKLLVRFIVFASEHEHIAKTFQHAEANCR